MQGWYGHEEFGVAQQGSPVQMELMFCSREGGLVEASYLWEVWGRRGRVAVL